MNNIWIDCTHLIDEKTLVYPGDPIVKIDSLASIEKDGYSIRTIHTGMHVGTHVDSPSHFMLNQDSIDLVDFNRLVGKANVIHLRNHQGVLSTEKIIEEYQKIKNHHSILLIDTGFDQYFNTLAYFQNYPVFEESFFAFIQSTPINVIGLDLPTIAYTKNQPSKAHLDFLGQNYLIIEGLNQLKLLNDEVEFIGLPLKIKPMDGSLIRAIAKNI